MHPRSPSKQWNVDLYNCSIENQNEQVRLSSRVYRPARQHTRESSISQRSHLQSFSTCFHLGQAKTSAVVSGKGQQWSFERSSWRLNGPFKNETPGIWKILHLPETWNQQPKYKNTRHTRIEWFHLCHLYHTGRNSKARGQSYKTYWLWLKETVCL